MIKNIILEFYQFILLIIMIFITVYVWIKSIIKCSSTYSCKNTINENTKLKKYILYTQKYPTNFNKSNKSKMKNNINTDNIIY